MDGWLLQLTRVGAIGTGVMTGIFLIFSVCIMPALDRLPAADVMSAMQQINEVIQNAFFVPLFVGTGLVGAALAITSAWTWDQPGAALRLAAGLLYVAGAVVLTAAYHIPRNDALDAIAASSAEAPDVWARYLKQWVPWNHVRTLASAAAAIMLTVVAAD